MRTIEQIVKDAIGENPGAVVACTRDELLHGLNARQATHDAWNKLKGQVEATADELVVVERNELLEALDAEIFAAAEAGRRALAAELGEAPPATEDKGDE